VKRYSSFQDRCGIGELFVKLTTYFKIIEYTYECLGDYYIVIFNPNIAAVPSNLLQVNKRYNIMIGFGDSTTIPITFTYLPLSCQ
jgi:hypothetical protein